jgi:chromosome segregation ATPase
MTLEELADLIRANSANTNGRIDGIAERVHRVVDHVRDLHSYIDRAQNETNAALMNIQNDFTDVRGEIKAIGTDAAEMRRDMSTLKSDVAEVKQTLDLVATVAAMRREIDTLAAEIAELKRRAS